LWLPVRFGNADHAILLGPDKHIDAIAESPFENTSESNPPVDQDMLLRGRTCSLRQRVKWIGVGLARRPDLIVFAPEHCVPAFDNILHAQGVKGDMLPLKDRDGLIGEGVDAQAQYGNVRSQIVLDTARLVSRSPREVCQLVRITDNCGSSRRLRYSGRCRMRSRRHVVVDMAEGDCRSVCSKLGRNTPLDLA
jgi:hypothetical protein